MQLFEKITKKIEKTQKYQACNTQKEVTGIRTKQSMLFSKHLLAVRMTKSLLLTSKLVSLGLSILKIIKIVMYDFWYDYVKPKHGENEKYVT